MISKNEISDYFKSLQDQICEEIENTDGKCKYFEDVWEHRRVSIKGRISYDAEGNIARVFAESVIPLKSRTMTTHDIRDTDFTGTDSVLEYLERLREG